LPGRGGAVALAPLAVACALIAGCGGSSGSGGSGASTGSSGAGSSGLVKPGTSLKLGTTAKVTYTPLTSSGNGKPSTLKVTVRSFQKGSVADLKGLQFEGNIKGDIPQYATVTVTNLGPRAIDVDGTSDAMQGIDGSGTEQDAVSFIGDFPHCQQNESTTPVASGHTFHTCLTFLVPGGVKKVAYTGTDDYLSSPVTWGPS
jgi:hypothetical protein